MIPDYDLQKKNGYYVEFQWIYFVDCKPISILDYRG